MPDDLQFFVLDTMADDAEKFSTIAAWTIEAFVAKGCEPPTSRDVAATLAALISTGWSVARQSNKSSINMSDAEGVLEISDILQDSHWYSMTEVGRAAWNEWDPSGSETNTSEDL